MHVLHAGDIIDVAAQKDVQLENKLNAAALTPPCSSSPTPLSTTTLSPPKPTTTTTTTMPQPPLPLLLLPPPPLPRLLIPPRTQSPPSQLPTSWPSSPTPTRRTTASRSSPAIWGGFPTWGRAVLWRARRWRGPRCVTTPTWRSRCRLGKRISLCSAISGSCRSVRWFSGGVEWKRRVLLGQDKVLRQ